MSNVSFTSGEISVPYSIVRYGVTDSDRKRMRGLFVHRHKRKLRRRGVKLVNQKSDHVTYTETFERPITNFIRGWAEMGNE